MSDVLFQSGDIVVTRAIARIGDTSYPIANIGSVSVEPKPDAASSAVVVAGLFAAIMLCIAYNWMVATTATFGVAIFAYAISSVETVLTLKTSSVDVQAFSSEDNALVLQVKDAIEFAFTSHGFPASWPLQNCSLGCDRGASMIAAAKLLRGAAMAMAFVVAACDDTPESVTVEAAT